MKRLAELLSIAAVIFVVVGLAVLVVGFTQGSHPAELAGVGLCASAVILFLFCQVFHVRARLDPPQPPGQVRTPYNAIKAAQQWEQTVADQNERKE